MRLSPEGEVGGSLALPLGAACCYRQSWGCLTHPGLCLTQNAALEAGICGVTGELGGRVEPELQELSEAPLQSGTALRCPSDLEASESSGSLGAGSTAPPGGRRRDLPTTVALQASWQAAWSTLTQSRDPRCPSRMCPRVLTHGHGRHFPDKAPSLTCSTQVPSTPWASQGGSNKRGPQPSAHSTSTFKGPCFNLRSLESARVALAGGWLNPTDAKAVWGSPAPWRFS